MARLAFVFILSIFLFGDVSAQSSAFAQGKFDDALDSCEKNYEEASREKHPSAVFGSLTGIFDVYRRKGEMDKAFFYAQRLYRIAEHDGNHQWLFTAAWCLAEIYFQEGDFQDALHYFRLANSVPHTIPSRVDPDASFWLEWADTYSRLDQFDSAEMKYALYRASGDTSLPVYRVSIGEYFYSAGRFPEALSGFRSALSGYQSVNGITGLLRTYPDLARTALVLGDTVSALQFGYIALRLATSSKVDPSIRDACSILSDAYAKLGRTDSANFYFAKYSAVRETILNDLVKTKFAAYRFEQQLIALDREKQVQSLQLKKESLEKRGLLAACILLAALAVAIFLIAGLARKNLRRKTQLAEIGWELQALRARMDPHFIFNSLNSINRFIIRNDPNTAANYLTKFAKLMRQVLESSANPFIPLSDELEILNNYLTLENLRFEKPFTWNIDLSGIDPSSILIPTLLIQPFVENAIWHGLHPLPAGGGILSIRFRLADDLLHCEILDNGIGRNSSAILKTAADPSGAQTSKNPLGIAITAARLERIARSMHPKTGQITTAVLIYDLKKDTGEALGTRVSLDIPVKQI